MERISVELHYAHNREQLLAASMNLVRDIYKVLLGHEPIEEDKGRLDNRINPVDNSINDIYFDNKKVGSLTTTFIPGSPTGIQLEFIPIE